MIKIITFLGNPGSNYSKNRHNAGALFADEIPISLQWQKKFKGIYAAKPVNTIKPKRSVIYDGMEVSDVSIKYADEDVNTGNIHFLIPQTYMNLSGESVQAAAAFFKIKPEEIFVVHDELDLALGQASIKFGGGLGGHNGLRSIKACLNSADFWRLRIGIGRPSGDKNPQDDISAWVLSDFTKSETAILEQVFAYCAAVISQLILQGPDSLLPEWKKKQCA